jgi:hypothetical protein
VKNLTRTHITLLDWGKAGLHCTFSTFPSLISRLDEAFAQQLHGKPSYWTFSSPPILELQTG